PPRLHPPPLPTLFPYTTLFRSLHKLRSGGKKLFVLTNSLWDYTDSVMSFLLDGRLPEYPSWRNYFDYVVVGAMKPAFFAEQRPLDRKSTRLNSSHRPISYAVFC